jgi:serine/threonine protein kinase
MEVDPSARTEAGVAGPASAELGPGASVGKYRLDRVLGTGGMGVVWAAYDPDLERPVAIKVLRSIDSIATLRTRLLREARAMARLKHPNILTVYEVGTDRNRDYIAMELIDGADLDRWLASKPPGDEVVAAMLASGRGLAAAHDAGLIHRDFKPHNILRGRDGSVYVSDFGLARGQIEDGADVVQAPVSGLAATLVASASQPRATDSVLDSPLTQTGVLIGTPAYMAPEQFLGHAPDPRSDQFAFCVTAWEALSGARPFAGKNLDELRLAAAGGVRGDGGLPPRIRSVLARGLSPDPADRWPDMRVLLGELERAIAPRRRSRVPVIVTAVVAMASIATGVVLYTTGVTRRSERGTTPRVMPPQPPMLPSSLVPPMPPMPPNPPNPRKQLVPPSVPDPRRTSLLPPAGCVPATEAFGSAWSPERRRAVIARHKSEATLIPVTGMLDEFRSEWLKNYGTACAMPESEARHERLACLLGVRGEIDDTTRDLAAEDSSLSVTELVPLGMAAERCQD